MRHQLAALLLLFAACSRSKEQTGTQPSHSDSTEGRLEQLRRGCDAGRGADCWGVGAYFQDGTGVEPSLSEAARYYERGCELDNPAACHAAGQSYLLGAGVARDIEKAIPLLGKACAGSDPHGCFKLGSVYSGGAFGPVRDPKAGLHFFSKACDLGLAQGCVRAGTALEVGADGIEKDVVRALAYYESGCGVKSGGQVPEGVGSFGQASACLMFGLLCRSGKSVERHAQGETALLAAHRHFSEQCDKGGPMECHLLAGMYQSGAGVKVDTRRARELFVRSCDLKNPAACEAAKNLEETQPSSRD